MNKLIIIGIAISAIASVMIVNFPALIAQYSPSDKPSPEVIEECKQLGIPVFMCSENQILAKKRTIAAQQNPVQQSDTYEVDELHLIQDLQTRIAVLERDVELLKQNAGLDELLVQDVRIVMGDSASTVSFTITNSNEMRVTIDGLAVRGSAITAFKPFTLQPDESKSVEYTIQKYVLSSTDIGAAVTVKISAGKLSTAQSAAVTRG